MDSKELHHGGDLGWAQANFAFQGGNWLDLSTGINPVPYPVGHINGETYNRLPDAHLEHKALSAAASYYGVPSTSLLAFAPGSQALIQWLPRLRPLSTVAVVGPTYQEHARCWGLAGHDVQRAGSLAEARQLSTDVIVLVRPNNPTGHSPDVVDIEEAAADLAQRDGWLILDEAFADTCPESDLRELAGSPGLITLKSFGKFFGLAGLRLGVAISDEQTASLIQKAVGPWSVPGPTLAIATKAYLDSDWVTQTRERLQTDSERIDRMLVECGCSIIGGTNLFRLVELEAAQHLLIHLGDRGILTRHFPYNSKWLRFGLPALPNDWDRLEEALNCFKADKDQGLFRA